MSSYAGAASAAAVAWVKNDALPLWHRLGWDPGQGGFVERLDKCGCPDFTAPRRVRVQARQVYVFAHAAVLGWYEPARQVALDGFDWLVAKCRKGPGFVHVIEADGTVVDGRYDAYDQAFALLALAWVFRLTGDSQVRRLIDEELAFIDSEIADPEHGGWREGVPPALPRRQNPQMHAFEAMLALYEATGDAAFLRRAETFLALLQTRLFEPKTGTLLEYFGPTFAPSSDPAKLVVEPGHHFEWVWLLAAYARMSGKPLPPQTMHLYDWARAHGLGIDGLVIDECRPDGTALLPSHRLWPQTEYIKANLALAEHGLSAEAACRAEIAFASLAKYYFTRDPVGGWIDRLDAEGRILDGRMPSSSFYHIFCAIAEAARLGATRQARDPLVK